MITSSIQMGVRLFVVATVLLGAASPALGIPGEAPHDPAYPETRLSQSPPSGSTPPVVKRVVLPEVITPSQPGLAIVDVANKGTRSRPVTLGLIGVTGSGERYVLGERRNVRIANRTNVKIPIGAHEFEQPTDLSVYVVTLDSKTNRAEKRGTQLAGPFTVTVKADPDVGSFRILASNDADPDRATGATTTIYDYSDLLSGGDEELERESISDGLPPWALDRASLTARETRDIATRTDGFRHLASTPIYIAHGDDWIPLTDGSVTDVVIYRNYDSEGPDYYVFAHVEPRPGYLPVRNAAVETDADGSLTVTNPNQAEVNVGEYLRYRTRLEQGADAVTNSGLFESRYPASGDTSWYDMGGTADVSGVFSDETYAVIADHWAGIARTSPGVFYQGQFVSDPGPMRVYAPTDFRIYVPPDHQEIDENECEITYNNTTYYFDETEWEQWDLESSDQDVRVTLHESGGDGPARWASSTGTDNVYRFDKSTLPGGDSGILRVNSTVQLTLEQTYGEYSPCGSWSASTTITRTKTVTKSYDFTVHTPESLSVTVYAVDKDPLNRMVMEINGDRSLTEQAIGYITVTMGGKTYTVSGPWRFYPMTLYGSVETRSHDDVTTQQASYKQPLPGDTVPHLYRDYAEPEAMVVTNQTLTLVSRERTIKRNLSGGTLPPSVIHGTGKTPLYKRWSGTVVGVSDSELSSTQVHAVDVFGNPITTQVKQITYQDTSLTFTQTGTTVFIRLTSNGNPLSGRTLHLTGTTQETAVTNNSGWVSVEANDSIVKANFQGTPLTTESGPYYDSASDSVIVSALFYVPAGNVYEWLALFVNRLFIIAEWIALLLIILWVGWIMRGRRSKQSRSR